MTDVLYLKLNLCEPEKVRVGVMPRIPGIGAARQPPARADRAGETICRSGHMPPYMTQDPALVGEGIPSTDLKSKVSKTKKAGQ